MPLAIVHSRGLDGLAALEVAVEVHLAAGLPNVTVVGLPDTEVREARDRVRAALQNAGFEFPRKRITVNQHFDSLTQLFLKEPRIKTHPRENVLYIAKHLHMKK